MDDFRSIQEEELQVLRSIYMEDFQSDISTQTAWKSVNAAHEFTIHIKPLSKELIGKVGVGIHFKLPIRYPKVLPTWKLERGIGLSAAQINALVCSFLFHPIRITIDHQPLDNFD